MTDSIISPETDNTKTLPPEAALPSTSQARYKKLVFFGCLAALLFGIVGYILGTRFNFLDTVEKERNETANDISQISSPTPTLADSVKNEVEYTSVLTGLTMKLPENWFSRSCGPGEVLFLGLTRISECTDGEIYEPIHIVASSNIQTEEQFLRDLGDEYAVTKRAQLQGVVLVHGKYYLKKKKPSPGPVEYLLYRIHGEKGILSIYVNEVQFEAVADQIVHTMVIQTVLNVDEKQSKTANAVPVLLPKEVENISYTLPEGWQAKIVDGKLHFSETNGGWIVIEAYAYPSDVGRREYYCLVTSYCIEGTTSFTERKIGNLSGYAASGLDNSGGGGEYFGVKDGIFYVISFKTSLVLNKDNDPDYQAMVVATQVSNAFLQSLRF
jgi:hypothetical protein